ncbi:MAG: phenylalanine--tRNA ligase subunit beta [Acidobacteria bacterium]|nr:phenylalanine--tRNA ligase subunit beta [Acidobacteriota bacterium]
MNISYNWLRELSGTRLEPRELSERLTMLGLAVEGVHEAGDDFVLDIDLTSNRPDCLSHLGVAREVAAMEGTRVQLPESKPQAVARLAEELTAVEILDPILCPRYAARVVQGVRIGPSPDWLVKRLEAIGQRSINNVADITNYVLHEVGQPLHAFDLAKLSEQRIVVRRARAGEKLKTLDGVLRELDTEMLVIADAEKPVALAGVMGGEDSEISEATVDVLIESAYFNPDSVRRTARRLGMHTEASHRFERGADYAAVLRAQERCVALICELAGGTATENAIDVYPRPLNQPVVSLRPERVKALTGLNLAAVEMENILTSLGFSQTAKMSNSEAVPSLRDGVIEELPISLQSKMSFVPPTWRVDISIEEDLVEEVARHAGYDRIATELPASGIAGEYQPDELQKLSMRGALVANGYDEAISFSFIDAGHDETFELIPEFAAREEKGEQGFVTLSNSIIEGATRMRPTLLAGLLSAVRHNFNHGTRDVRLFETGRIFLAHEKRLAGMSDEKNPLPLEREALALVATGGATEEMRAGHERELDFYDLKGALEAAVDAMNLLPLLFEAASARHLREGQSAVISLSDGKRIGYLGRLSEEIAAEYKFRQPVYVAELDLTALLEAPEATVLYTPLARYPSVTRDVSLLVARRTGLAELLAAVNAQEVEFCRDAKLVGVYEGASLPEGKRSVTLRLEYRADEQTLRDEEVDEMHKRIVSALEEKFDAQQRA